MPFLCTSTYHTGDYITLLLVIIFNFDARLPGIGRLNSDKHSKYKSEGEAIEEQEDIDGAVSPTSGQFVCVCFSEYQLVYC